MRCPSLSQLPPPPPGKTGWPWTEETEPLADTMPDGGEWPKISIVTPSYNQAQFIEETIRSVLLQGYPNLEYMIMDGASTDDSVNIISKYQQFLCHWVSEPDRGQSHAINKGFAKTTGNILAWINSDDFLKPGALEIVAKTLSNSQTPTWLIGGCEITNEISVPLFMKSGTGISYAKCWNWLENWFPQQSTFWHRHLWSLAGLLDESLHYAMDFDFWLRLFLLAEPITIDTVISAYRYHDNAKCISQQSLTQGEVNLVVIKNLKALQLNSIQEMGGRLEKFVSSQSDISSLKLRDTNFIIFADPEQSEQCIYEELVRVITSLENHPDCGKMTLLVNAGKFPPHLTQAFTEQLCEEEEEGLQISVVGKLSPLEWAALLPQVTARIVLAQEDGESVGQLPMDGVPLVTVDG
ncbi:glycosyltransferase family 2 protein [Anabaena sp. CS-542/02]|uniref:glycosyltransferase family 2 protein n=1 Tax=Anabaena sp. CS-542/02 TaxID=3021719 RepID=UPI00232DC2BD|nr:glycosyltransferase family 2 protein [Anabaena sp. CS-542/02]MDB9447418.1 glycosyltransferase family 2 protein [Anabaena sp. CS-542/02]